LQPHLRLLDLRYPVDQMLLGIRREQRVIDIASNAVTDLPPRRRGPKRSLPKRQKVFLAVHRADDSVYFKRLDAEAFAILCDLRDGKRLSDAVEHVEWRETSGEQAAERIQAWFALWASLGWFCKSN
jgi:hypothetical protein